MAAEVKVSGEGTGQCTMIYQDYINFALAVAGLTLAVMGLVMNITIPFDVNKDRPYFTVLFSLLTGYMVSDIMASISLEIVPDSSPLFSAAAVFFESLFSSLIMPVLTVYMLHCTGENWRKSPLMAVVAALWLLYFSILVVTQFTSHIYYFTPNNVYHRGPWYQLLLAPPVLLMIVNLFALYRRRNRLSKKQIIAFSTYMIIPLVCMVLQMMSYGLLMIVIGTSVAVFFMFVFMFQDQVDRYVEQQNENVRQRTSIKILQMRPHFIYNTMTSIYYLCGEDTKKAQKVISDFTNYLRHNFTAITNEETIPFSEELEHVRAYLAVEKARYEDKLFIKYDTPHTSFRVPPLTVQPIVENAVKYGISPDLEPLYITVTTRDTGSGAEIVVEDTGPGYNPSDSSEPHVALENTRERIRVMCGGTLTIAPRESGGTTVTIQIPAR